MDLAKSQPVIVFGLTKDDINLQSLTKGCRFEVVDSSEDCSNVCARVLN